MERGSLKIFDAHVHTEFSSPGSFETYRCLMRANNIVGALTDSTNPGASTNALSALAIHRCGVIGPNSGTLDEMRVGIEAGLYQAIKINLGFLHKFPDDQSLLPIYELAARNSLPLFFHTGDTGWNRSKLKFAHPLAIDELATDYRNVQIVLVHAGNPWFVDAALVASKNNNVSLEISSIMEGDISACSREHIERIFIEPLRNAFHYVGDPRKFLFGSGWPMVRFETYLDACLEVIPSAHWDLVFRENAMTLLRLTSLSSVESHASN